MCVKYPVVEMFCQLNKYNLYWEKRFDIVFGCISFDYFYKHSTFNIFILKLNNFNYKI